jgi:tetratricopeptide (TPR) repeat protein
MLAWSPSSRGSLDPEVATPYQIKVVLRIAEHRLLTPIFRDQVERELRDGLAGALGELGKVEIVKEHPLLAEINKKGLQPTLEAWTTVTGIKHHFVLIDFVDGRYQIETAQHDGLTGLASPVVRRTQTTDRQFVARAAALLVDRDLGLVGTLPDGVPGNEVRIVLKGGKLGVPLSRWVKKNEVFALSKILPSGSGPPRGQRVEWALLQVIELPDAEGVCLCRFLSRYKDPLAGGSPLGVRCVKLGTSKGPLKLRLLDSERLQPPPTQNLLVSAGGFDAKNPEALSSDSEGLVVSKEIYEHVAFVRVLGETGIRAQFAVEILEDRILPCRINARGAGDTAAHIELLRRQWTAQLYESQLVVAELFKELNKLVEAKSNQAALDKARGGIAGIDAELTLRGDERKKLRDDARTANIPLDLSDGEQQIQELLASKAELAKFIDNLEKVIKEAPKKQALLAKVERARLLEGEADYDQAIALYEEFLKEAEGDQPDLRRHLEELKEAWKPRSPEHDKARKFLFETWAKAETARDIKVLVAEAVIALEVCKRANDKLGPRRLLKINVGHSSRLAKRLEAIQIKDSEENRREAELIASVADDLSKLTKLVRDYLKPPEKKE